MPVPEVILRTGESVPEPVLKTTCISLSALEFLDLYEAVQLAREPSYQLWGPSSRKLHSLGLLGSDGTMHELTAQIIRAATEGEEFGIHLVSPILP